MHSLGTKIMKDVINAKKILYEIIKNNRGSDLETISDEYSKKASVSFDSIMFVLIKNDFVKPCNNGWEVTEKQVDWT